MSKNFLRTAQIALVLVYAVILAGSVVRASGAGMGCPDWPKCFGTWVPPTDASQLPADYQTRYAGEHNAVGVFNAAKTWTEYVNRLFGALLGIAVFVQLIFASNNRQKEPRLFWLALAMFFWVGFQGWLGARVVASNLAPLKITTHMVVALLILAMGTLMVFRLKNRTTSHSITAHPLLIWVALLLTMVQIILGTQVRESVDELLLNVSRNGVIDQLGLSFIVHRSLSWLVVGVNAWMIYQWLQQNSLRHEVRRLLHALGFVLIVEFLVGVALSWLSFPAAAQPTHLLLACIVFGLQVSLLLHQRQAQNSHSLAG